MAVSNFKVRLIVVYFFILNEFYTTFISKILKKKKKYKMKDKHLVKMIFKTQRNKEIILIKTNNYYPDLFVYLEL